MAVKPRFEGATNLELIDYLEKKKMTDWISIGGRTNYLFIGPLAELPEWLKESGAVHILRCRIKGIYQRKLCKGDAVIIDTYDIGKYWTRDDYIKDRNGRRATVRTARKPRAEHIEAIEAQGLNPNDWLIADEDNYFLYLTDRGIEQRMQIKIPWINKQAEPWHR